MKAIVLGGGSDQRSLIEELNQRGITSVLVDYYQNPPAKELVNLHYVVSTLDQEAVLDIARREKADIVVSSCIDQALLTAAYVSEELDLYWPLSYLQTLRATNKYFMKDIFWENGIPTAKFKVIEGDVNVFNLGLSYPLVVKPADSNGSYGVRKINDETELEPAVAQALGISRSHKIVIEEHIDGVELSIDAFVCDGQIHLLLITETRKIPSNQGAFPICQSHYPVSLSRETLLKIEMILYRIVAAYELKNTPLLVQVVVSDGEVFVIEFGARIAGGSKHHLIKHITGFDVIGAFVDTLFQRPVKIEIHPFDKHVATNYVYANPGVFSTVVGVDSLIREQIIVDFFPYKTSGMEITSSGASRDRIGAFIVEADNIDDLHHKLAQADTNLQVLDKDEKDIMLHGIFL